MVESSRLHLGNPHCNPTSPLVSLPIQQRTSHHLRLATRSPRRRRLRSRRNILRPRTSRIRRLEPPLTIRFCNYTMPAQIRVPSCPTTTSEPSDWESRHWYQWQGATRLHRHLTPTYLPVRERCSNLILESVEPSHQMERHHRSIPLADGRSFARLSRQKHDGLHYLRLRGT